MKTRFKVVEPGQGKPAPFPMLENLSDADVEKLAVFSSESFGEIFAAENPMILWGVFLSMTELDGKERGAIGHLRLPRDEAKRLEGLRCAKYMLPVGAIWLKTSGDEFAYTMLELSMRLYSKEQNDKLMTMIHELLKVEFGDGRTLIVDDAFE